MNHMTRLAGVELEGVGITQYDIQKVIRKYPIKCPLATEGEKMASLQLEQVIWVNKMVRLTYLGCKSHAINHGQ